MYVCVRVCVCVYAQPILAQSQSMIDDPEPTMLSPGDAQRRSRIFTRMSPMQKKLISSKTSEAFTKE